MITVPLYPKYWGYKVQNEMIYYWILHVRNKRNSRCVHVLVWTSFMKVLVFIRPLKNSRIMSWQCLSGLIHENAVDNCIIRVTTSFRWVRRVMNTFIVHCCLYWMVHQCMLSTALYAAHVTHLTFLYWCGWSWWVAWEEHLAWCNHHEVIYYPSSNYSWLQFLL